MSDIYNKEKRSEVMRNIKSKGNKTTEIRLIELFNEEGIKGWRRGYPVKGHPDFVFLSKRIAVFVDGCFWHGHDCRNTKPKNNEVFWTKKIDGNIEHDKSVTKMFERRGWRVIRIWECEFREENRKSLIEKINKVLNVESSDDRKI